MCRSSVRAPRLIHKHKGAIITRSVRDKQGAEEIYRMAARGLAVPLGSVHGAFSGARFRGARRRWRDLARWGLDFALFTQFALFPFFALAHLWCTVPQAFEDKIN